MAIITVAFPNSLYTDDGITGANARLRVDNGDTDFFAGRKFAADISGQIPVAGPAVYFRFTAPINFILWVQQLELTQGALQLKWFVNPTTVSGDWTDIDPTYLNDSSDRPLPHYVPQCQFAYGGSFTGGTPIGPALRVRTASGNNRTTNVGERRSERYRGPNTYYAKLETLVVPSGGTPINDAADYTYTFEYAERP